MSRVPVWCPEGAGLKLSSSGRGEGWFRSVESVSSPVWEVACGSPDAEATPERHCLCTCRDACKSALSAPVWALSGDEQIKHIAKQRYGATESVDLELLSGLLEPIRVCYLSTLR